MKSAKIHKKPISPETEVSDLRNRYINVNRCFTTTLTALKELTEHANEAVQRSASSAIKAAAIALAHQAEEPFLVASAKAATTEAVKMPHLAADAARLAVMKKDK